MAVLQYSFIIFSVAHKWKMAPDPLKFFLCYFPHCSKSSIISSPDVNKKNIKICETSKFSAVVVPIPQFHFPLSWKIKAMTLLPCREGSNRSRGRKRQLVTPVLQATRQHTDGLRGESFEIGYNAGRFWPPLAIKRGRWVICLATTSEIQYGIEVVGVRAPFFAQNFKNCLFRGQSFINLQLLQPHLNPF